MAGLGRRRAEQGRRRTRALLLAGLVGLGLAAVAFLAAGLLWPGLCCAVAGLVTVVAAGRHARPDNWTPEGRDHESR